MSDPEETTGNRRVFVDVGEPERRVSSGDIRAMRDAIAEIKSDIHRLERLPVQLAEIKGEMKAYVDQNKDLRTDLGSHTTQLGTLKSRVDKAAGVASWTNALVFVALIGLAATGWYTAVAINNTHSEMSAARR